MSNQPRKKAQELFSTSAPVFGRKVPFSEAFPDISDFRIEVDEMTFEGRTLRTWVFTPSHLPTEFVDCTNDLCYGGGVSVGSVLATMRASRLGEYESKVKCRGYEGSSRQRTRSCLHRFRIRATVSYADEAKPEVLPDESTDRDMS